MSKQELNAEMLELALQQADTEALAAELRRRVGQDGEDVSFYLQVAPLCEYSVEGVAAWDDNRTVRARQEGVGPVTIIVIHPAADPEAGVTDGEGTAD